jgi:hypothetical protein
VVVDLVSPWLAAVETSPTAQHSFRSRHAGLLELVRRQRTPVLTEFPLQQDPAALRAMAQRAGADTLHQLLDDLVLRARGHGADRCEQVILVPSAAAGELAAPLRLSRECVALLLHGDWDHAALERSLSFALAALTRWTAADSRSPVARLAADQWGMWQAGSTLPLRESIVTAGLGVHLLAALFPDRTAASLLGIHATACTRLREREKTLRRQLATDLDQSGIGLVLRWLTPDAPASARQVAGGTLAPMTGHYLGWRMLRPLVERDGLAGAMRSAV